MARKRMFDSEIINQDSFYDLPMEAKALYFLLGMEADDEGFVSPKKVLRLYGGTDDSIKILILKKYIIPFSSGVIVITDWKRNNYLDKNRIKETIYLEEKSMLDYNETTQKYELTANPLIPSVKQMLNECLTSIEENSIEEKSIEENNILSVSDENEPRKKVQRGEEITEIIEYLNNRVGTKYRPTSKETKKHINARLEEGFTVEQFKEVIDKKANQWIGTEMEQYLRPSTLFGTKFESYLNAYVNPIQAKPNNTKEKVTFADLLKGGYINDEE